MLRLVKPYVIIPAYFVLEPLGMVFSKMQPDEEAHWKPACLIRSSEFVGQLRAISNDAPGVVSGQHHYMPCCDVNLVDVYFTHGDLNLWNILVEDWWVTGIVDWACAGWYPGY